jgi:hypothetical protein
MKNQAIIIENSTAGYNLGPRKKEAQTNIFGILPLTPLSLAIFVYAFYI